MIDIERLKPILKDLIPEEAMSDAVVRVSEIDEKMDDKSDELQKANDEIQKLKDSNAKLTGMFFTGQKIDNPNPLPDEPAEDEDEEDTDTRAERFEDLFDTHEYKKGEDKLNG